MNLIHRPLLVYYKKINNLIIIIRIRDIDILLLNYIVTSKGL